MLRLKLGPKTNDSNLQQVLTLQQTRVVDEEEQLKRIFPSWFNLNNSIDQNQTGEEDISIDIIR